MLLEFFFSIIVYFASKKEHSRWNVLTSASSYVGLIIKQVLDSILGVEITDISSEEIYSASEDLY